MAGTRSRRKWQGLRLPQGAETMVSLFLLLFDTLLLDQVFTLTFTLWLRSDPQFSFISILICMCAGFCLRLCQFWPAFRYFQHQKTDSCIRHFFAYFQRPSRIICRLQPACLLFACRGLLCLHISAADLSSGDGPEHIYNLWAQNNHIGAA